MAKQEDTGGRRRLSFLPVLSIFSQLSGAQKPVVSIEDLGATDDIGSESKRSIDYYDDSPRFAYVPVEGLDGYSLEGTSSSPSLHRLNSSGSLRRTNSRKDLNGKEFWVRARVAFKSSLVTKEQLEAIRAKIAHDPLHPDADPTAVEGEGGVYSAEGFSGAFKVQDSKFAVEMREQWGKYIKEEVLLLKIERQNEEIIEEQAQMDGRRMSTSSRPSISSAEELDLDSLESMLQTEEREREAERKSSHRRLDHKLKTFLSNDPSDDGMVYSEMQDLDSEHNCGRKDFSPEIKKDENPFFADAITEGVNGQNSLPDKRADALAATSVGADQLLPGAKRLDADLSFRDMSEGDPTDVATSAPNERADSGDSDNDDNNDEAESDWRGPAPVKTHSHEVRPDQTPPRYPGGVPKSPAGRNARRAVLVRQASGIHAAAAAAEAAHTGGKRIRRMWDRMKGVVSKAMGRRGPMQSYGSLAMDRLSRSVMEGEVPAPRRGVAWLALVRLETQELDHMSRSQYQELLQQPSDFEAEIRRDIHRTFPKHEMFRQKGGPGQQALFNVTKAYAVLDEEVGYCQGMGFLVAIMLMNDLREDEAFSCIVYLMYRCGMRTLFLPDMDRLQVRLYQLSQLQAEYLPILNGHLEELGIKPVMYAAPWFLTLFCTSLPLPLVFRIFDVVLAEKTVAIVFKIGLILMQISRRQIMECHEMEHVMDYMRHEIAWHLNSFPVSELEEVMAKALRVDLPIESLLRLEAEYELLAEEFSTAAHEVEAAALASEAAARSWEHARVGLELRLLLALKMQASAEERTEALEARIRELEASFHDQSRAATSLPPRRQSTLVDRTATTTAGVPQVEQDATATSAPLHADSPPNPLAEVAHPAPPLAPSSAAPTPYATPPAEDEARKEPNKPETLTAPETPSQNPEDIKQAASSLPSEASTAISEGKASTGTEGATEEERERREKGVMSDPASQRGGRLDRAATKSKIDIRIADLEKQLASQVDFKQPTRRRLCPVESTETTTLLKAVVSLRQERVAIEESLRDAEKMLADRIRQENLRLTSKKFSSSP